MNAQSDQLRLFGLDISPLMDDLIQAWRGMLNWPVFAWLWPNLAVRLYLKDGQSLVCRGLSALPVELQSPRLTKSAKFSAVLLPEDILLRKSWSPPALTGAETDAARALLAQSISPFAPSDLVWIVAQSAGGVRSSCEQIVLSSRALIFKHLDQFPASTRPKNPEVWIENMEPNSYVVVKGYGESLRQRRESVGKWINSLQLLLLLAILCVCALSPSIQLQMRYVEAERAMASLQKMAAPVLQERQQLVQTVDRLAELSKLTGSLVPPLQTLDLITKALPDDTSLLALQIQGDKVSISGQTGNAAALMKQLGSTAGLRDVTAPSPATKPLGATRESFAIAFVLDPVKKAAP